MQNNTYNILILVLVYFLIAYLFPIKRGKQSSVSWLLVIACQTLTILFIDFVRTNPDFSLSAYGIEDYILYAILFLLNVLVILLFNLLIKKKPKVKPEIVKKEKNKKKKVKKEKKAKQTKEKKKKKITKNKDDKTDIPETKNDIDDLNKTSIVSQNIVGQDNLKEKSDFEPAFSDTPDFNVEDIFSNISPISMADLDESESEVYIKEDDENLEDEKDDIASEDENTDLVNSETNDVIDKKVFDVEDVLTNVPDISDEDLKMFESIIDMLKNENAEEASKYLRIVAYFGKNKKLAEYAKEVLERIE